MQINLESSETHTITSYDDSHITINHITYGDSLIVSKQTIISPWPVHSVTALSEILLTPIIQLQPDVIILGHKQLGLQIPIMIVQYLAKLGIGIESMSIGAASRTYNVLLSEERNVVAAMVF